VASRLSMWVHVPPVAHAHDPHANTLRCRRASVSCARDGRLWPQKLPRTAVKICQCPASMPCRGADQHACEPSAVERDIDMQTASRDLLAADQAGSCSAGQDSAGSGMQVVAS
jgi:hypothetical protein